MSEPRGLPADQFTHEELRSLLDAVSQHLENEDPDDDENVVPGSPAAHSARERLESYFASFAEPQDEPSERLERVRLAMPRHPLDGATAGLVRRDPFRRFVIVRVLEDAGEYGAGTDVRVKPDQVVGA